MQRFEPTETQFSCVLEPCAAFCTETTSRTATSHTAHIQAAPTITKRLIHIDCGAGFAGPKSTVGGGLRPPPTVDLSIDVNIDLVVIVGTLVAVAIAVATVDLVGCTGAWVFRQLQLAAYRDLGYRGQTGCGLDLRLLDGQEGRADDVGHPNWLWLWL